MSASLPSHHMSSTTETHRMTDLTHLIRSTRRLAALSLLCIATCVSAQDNQAGTTASQPLGPVGLDYFGLNLNRAAPGQPWPSVRFGSWRLWDAQVSWPFLQPQPGQWKFDVLDRMVADAQAHNVGVLLVLGQSPAWASARPQEPSGYRPGFAAEPARLEDWVQYVSTVAQRYKGRIEAYQIWNEPDDKNHFSGSLAKYIELTCTAYGLIKGIDPAAKVVVGGTAGAGGHIEYLDRFLAGGGKACIDVVDHHFYVPRFGPEALAADIRTVRSVMRRNGVDSMPLWNTETGWWLANTDGTPDHPLVANGGWRKINTGEPLNALIQRAMLIARGEGVSRFYWYAWSNPYGWGLADKAGKAKPGVEGWNTVVDLMLGQTVSACGGSGTTYSCRVGPDRTVQWQIGDALTRREGPAGMSNALGSIPVSH